ncbi:AAA domain-containing protein [Oceanihabitans sediminis]|uniref:AAA domain-containing protein n=1 Tax=Oceanihabitans sediminis TaxID=1812012 RepID=UPI003A948BFA
MIKNRKQGGKVNFMQDIWKVHTDVQEQMLQLRSVPVSIIPESAKIVGEKLFLKVNENDKTDRFLERIKKHFNIESKDIDIIGGFFCVDLKHSSKVSFELKSQLSQKAAANFIEFLPNPIIDGYINKLKSPISDLKDILDKSNFDYDFDRNGRLQISINDLKLLNKMCSDENLNIQIPEQSSIIMPVYPNPLYFIKKSLPSLSAIHKSKVSIHNDGNVTWNRTIEISNVYLKEAFVERLNKEFGLTLIGYDFIFYIDSSVVGKYIRKESPYVLPKLIKENNSFVFHTNLNIKASNSYMMAAYNDEKWNLGIKYKRLIKFFNAFFGSENVRFESKFIYSYDIFKYTKEFLPSLEYSKEDLRQEVFNSMISESVSVSDNMETIGIDFDWRNEDLNSLLEDTSNKCQFLNLSIFNNHRCNIDFQIQDVSLDETENMLREKFPSIKTIRNNKKGTFYFYQEYQSQEQAILLKDMIQSELDKIDSSNFEKGLYNIDKDKEKYRLDVDISAKKDSQVSALKEIRGSDFNVNENYLGRLIRVNFPEMIFDISGDFFEKNKTLFERKIIDTIEPNLIGDIEKVNRLKDSLDNIVNGKNLQNPNLKDFIFDASKAKITEDIESHTHYNSQTYADLETHLMNNRVNEPQKIAIIKSLLAEDLALIQGPPGTGKSTAIAEIIWQHIRKDSEERILLTSETNLAVDNAIDRIVNDYHNLVKPIRFGSEDKLEIEGRQFSIETMKRWVETNSIDINENEATEDEECLPQKLILLNWIDNIKKRTEESQIDKDINELWKNFLSNPSKNTREIFYTAYVNNCNVIGATCSSIGENNTRGNPTSFFRSFCEIFGSVEKRFNREGKEYTLYNGDLKFSTVIQDESSKATPAELSLPLIYGKKNIIIGDHRQLPPLLDKESFMMSFDFLLDRVDSDEQSKQINKLKNFASKHFDVLEISHFERLFEKIDDSLRGVFNMQYRMHPDINEVIKQFYISDGGLQCGLIEPIDLGVNDPDMSNPASRYHGIEVDGLVSKDNHVIWIDTDSPELLDGTSRVNYGEVEAIKDILTKFRNSESFNNYQRFWSNPEDQQIGLISFYGKQIRLLKDLRKEFNDIPLRVSTVDRFQGMERNIIIVSMVRSNRIATDKNQKPDKAIYGDLGFQEQKELGFAKSPNRLNVALSRAKRLLIIVGNSELFRQMEIYDNVYQSIVSNPNGKIIKYETK